ncbi:MAG TPA: hypothetical protein VFM88_23560 [Vicinamibacteria bacterium]|nr:hypothetical protein [Vicinamibacteria bacterium]
MSTDLRVTTLEQAMLRTEASIERLSEEMRVFKDEMRASAERADARAERADRRWGELANKMGTLVEDIVAPGLPTIFRSVFGGELEPDLAIRVRRRHPIDPGRTQEFDAIASAGGRFLINETRSRLSPQDVADFLTVLAEARDFLPEARGQKLFGALASFYVDPSLVRAGERHGLLVLGLGRGLLEVLNSSEFHPREY